MTIAGSVFILAGIIANLHIYFEATSLFNMLVVHGVSCADGPATPDGYVKVSGSRLLPRTIAAATVFLNGWSSNYHGGDHHVRGLATMISNIAVGDGTIRWQAAGILRDDGSPSPEYGWCYRYTVVGWDPTQIALTAHHADGKCDANDTTPAAFHFTVNDGTTTALSVFPSYLRFPAFAGSREVAVLPRGYGFAYLGEEDNHVLQLGYRLFPLRATTAGTRATRATR